MIKLLNLKTIVLLNESISQLTIKELCERWQITELALFGSILSNNFDANSDIDILLTF